MSKTPFYKPPGSGPLHPVEANWRSQLAKVPSTKTTGHAITITSPPSGSSSLTAKAPLTIDRAGQISILSADSTRPGFLEPTDWSLFNSKEPGLGNPGTDGFVLVSTVAGARSWARSTTQPHAIATKTTTYTVLASDEVLLLDATGGAFTATLPTPVGIAGRTYTFKRLNSGANNATVATAAGMIDGAATVALTTQYQVLRVISDGANWFVI